MSQSSRIRVLFVAQGLRPTGPGRHLVKLLVYRNPAQVDVELFTFDRNDPEMLKMVTEEYGIKVTEVGVYFAHPMAYIRGIPMLLRRIREYQPHIIQTHHSPHCGLGRAASDQVEPCSCQHIACCGYAEGTSNLSQEKHKR